MATNISIDGTNLIPYVGFGQAITGGALRAALSLSKSRLTNIGIAAFDKGMAISKAYEAQVGKILRDLRGTQTGRAILEGIEGRHSKSVFIIPYLDVDPNATATPGNWMDSTPKGASMFNGGQDDLTTATDERMAILGTGSGLGSASIVRFTPQLAGYSGPLSRSDTTHALPGDLDDETLFHELVHSYRHVTGTLNRVPLSGNALGYGNTDEFLGVLITNIFMSELGRPVLRKHHSGYAALPRSETVRNGFFDCSTTAGTTNWESFLAAKLDSAMFGKLAVVNAPFNPFRDMTEAMGKMLLGAYNYFTLK